MSCSVVSQPVEAFQYKTRVGSLGGPSCGRSVTFIPSMKLLVDDRGCTFKSRLEVVSKAVSRAIDAYLKRVNDGECVYSEQELDRVIQQAGTKIMMSAEEIEQLLRAKRDSD